MTRAAQQTDPARSKRPNGKDLDSASDFGTVLEPPVPADPPRKPARNAATTYLRNRPGKARYTQLTDHVLRASFFLNRHIKGLGDLVLNLLRYTNSEGEVWPSKKTLLADLFMPDTKKGRVRLNYLLRILDDGVKEDGLKIPRAFEPRLVTRVIRRRLKQIMVKRWRTPFLNYLHTYGTPMPVPDSPLSDPVARGRKGAGVPRGILRHRVGNEGTN